MTETKDLKDLLRKAITPECSFRIHCKNVTVKQVSECNIENLEKGNFTEAEFKFYAKANIAILEGESISENTYNIEGFFDVDDDENVVIKGKISMTKR